MSYNGVGLQTPRGTGTSGYIQKNVANKQVEGHREKRARDAAETERREVRARMQLARRSAGQELKEHLDKRHIEVKCTELRDQLEDEDVDEDTIKRKVNELRKSLLSLPKAAEVTSDDSQGFHKISRRELLERQDKRKREEGSENLKKATQMATKQQTEDLSKENIDVGELKNEEVQKTKDDISTEDACNKASQKEEKTIQSEEKSNLDIPEKSSTYNYVPRYGQR